MSPIRPPVRRLLADLHASPTREVFAHIASLLDRAHGEAAVGTLPDRDGLDLTPDEEEALAVYLHVLVLGDPVPPGAVAAYGRTRHPRRLEVVEDAYARALRSGAEDVALEALAVLLAAPRHVAAHAARRAAEAGGRLAEVAAGRVART